MLRTFVGHRLTPAQIHIPTPLLATTSCTSWVLTARTITAGVVLKLQFQLGKEWPA